MTVATSPMTIARFHRLVFGSNISSPGLTYKRLNRIGIQLAKNTVLTPALVKKARAAYARYKERNPLYVQRLQSAANARALRRSRISGRASSAREAIPIPAGAQELALPLHVIPERPQVALSKAYRRNAPPLSADPQDREIAIMLLRAAVALLNR